MIQTIRQVYEDDVGAYLEVTKGEYGGNWVTINTTDETSLNYFGKVSLVLTNKMALELAAAIIATTKDVE